jgi:hypothetical protein
MKMKNLLSIFTSSPLTQTRIKFISSRDFSALAVKIRQLNPLCTLCPSSMQRVRVLSAEQIRSVVVDDLSDLSIGLSMRLVNPHSANYGCTSPVLNSGMTVPIVSRSVFKSSLSFPGSALSRCRLPQYTIQRCCLQNLYYGKKSVAGMRITEMALR